MVDPVPPVATVLPMAKPALSCALQEALAVHEVMVGPALGDARVA
jgi:hypothetical protein